MRLLRAKTPTLTVPLVPEGHPVPLPDSEPPVPVPPSDLLTILPDDDVIVEFDLDDSYAPLPHLHRLGNRTQQTQRQDHLKKKISRMRSLSLSAAARAMGSVIVRPSVSSKSLVCHPDDAVEETEVSLQESNPSNDFSQRWVLTTEPDEFDRVRYGLLTLDCGLQQGTGWTKDHPHKE